MAKQMNTPINYLSSDDGGGSDSGGGFWDGLSNFNDKYGDTVVGALGAYNKMEEDRKQQEINNVLAMNKAKWSGFRGGEMNTPVNMSSPLASGAGGAVQALKIADELGIAFDKNKRLKEREYEKLSALLKANSLYNNEKKTGLE